MKKWFSLLLCALLLVPTCGLAVTEGEVESAPPVELNAPPPAAADNASYLPDSSYYAGMPDKETAWDDTEEWTAPDFDGEQFYPVVQRPGFTPGEKARARKLMDAWKKGEKTGDGLAVLNVVENVVVGVYPLNPADYDGEQVYVLLPGVCLTDEQILNIIDAYAQLGLTFDPDALSFRNCSRGGGIGSTTRIWTSEERERQDSLSAQIRQGILLVEGIDLNPVAPVLQLDARYFCGSTTFTIVPYRRCSDRELAAWLFEQGCRDEHELYDEAALERQAREVLCGRMGLPLSMAQRGISATDGGYLPMTFDANGQHGYVGDGRRMQTVSFDFMENGRKVYADVNFDAESGIWICGIWMVNRMELVTIGTDSFFEAPSEETLLSDAEYVTLASAYAKEMLGVEGLSWTQQEDGWLAGSQCKLLSAILPGDELLEVWIGPATGEIYGAQLSRNMVDALGLTELITWDSELEKPNH